ncbi:YoaK family protein [Brevundimonas sp.]|uniref:YoaK family protein n=1 Tax=Brevundimonas sp. TaxID=1871086 RepID=UPI002EDBB508
MVRHYPRHLRVLAVGLAGLAGFVDAIAFLQLGGFFVSFMSGNSTRLGVGLVQAGGVAATAAGLVVSFVAGVVLGSLTGRRAGFRQRSAVLALVVLLLTAAGLVQNLGQWLAGGLLLAMAMGAENAAFERDGQASFGVTYMTGALVRVGQGLATAATGGDRWGWTPYLFLWLGLVGGAWAGALAFAFAGGASVWIATLCAALLFTASLSAERVSHKGL